MKEKQKKKLLAVAGFLGLFSAIIYFGYRQFVPEKTLPVKQSDSLNTKLPAIQQPVKPLSKMEMYMQAEKDSMTKQEQRARDPYSNAKRDSVIKSEKRFKNLYADLDRAVNASTRNKTVREIKTPAENSVFTDNFQRQTEPVVSRPQNNAAATDPELQQLSSMLDKLTELHNPAKSLKVKKADSTIVITTTVDKTIQAVVHQDQVIANGGMLKLRLLQDITVNGVPVPRGCFVYGICQINNERLLVQLTNIACHNQVLPFPMQVYDMDGMEGIYMPGTITRETGKEGADNVLQSLQLSSFDQGLAAQAATAGINAAKNLVSRKVRMVRVTAKAGHRVYLQKNS